MNEITKYENRKLYSRTDKMYVNLDDIKEMMKKGQAVVVTDYNGNDVTADVYKQILVKTIVPAATLKELIINN